MSAITHKKVGPDEDGMRVDRWFKLHYPGVTHAYLNKLLRTGQVRVDGGRTQANARLSTGQELRVPPLAFDKRPADAAPKDVRPLTREERDLFRSMVIFEDNDLYVLNKPAGLASQGGTKTHRHVDGLLMGLAAELGERPRLVHRLDLDTSGILVIAKRRAIAASLGKLFATRSVKKTYWAAVRGLPKPMQGKIDAHIIKDTGPFGDRMRQADPKEEGALKSTTCYSVVDKAPPAIAWVSLKPVTGRQHQLRIHMKLIGHPILGDDKYGGDNWDDFPDDLPNRLHLHARRILFPHPRGGKVDVTAPLPQHMRQTWKYFNFDPDRYDADEAE